jgi:hypothetical protein
MEECILQTVNRIAELLLGHRGVVRQQKEYK